MEKVDFKNPISTERINPIDSAPFEIREELQKLRDEKGVEVAMCRYQEILSEGEV